MDEQSPRYLYVALERKARPVVAPLHEPLTWTKSAAQHLSQGGRGLELTTDTSEGSYQAVSQAIPVPAGVIPIVDLQGTVHEGAIAIGMLNESLTDCGCDLPPPEFSKTIEIGTVILTPVRPNIQSEVVKEQIKSLPRQDKKLVCQDPRPLIQGSGTVRVCEWK